MSNLGSIMDAVLVCPRCHVETTVGNAEPDIDGEGSLGCPYCLTQQRKVVLIESKVKTYTASGIQTK